MVFDSRSYFESELAEHSAVLASTRDALAEDFTALVEVCATAIQSGNKLLFFGNGGSAADAQHLATELVVRFTVDRAPIAAIALTTDTSALTAIGNDFGFEALFARQLEALGNPGDVAIGISTSGRSPSVLNALDAARALKMTATGLSGGDGGDMMNHADPLLIVPSRSTARIQEMHITLGHMLCGALEIALGMTARRT